MRTRTIALILTVMAATAAFFFLDLSPESGQQEEILVQDQQLDTGKNGKEAGALAQKQRLQAPEAGQEKEPWTQEQLLEPAVLAETLNDEEGEKPVLIGLGYGGGIKGSVEVGETRDREGMENLKAEVLRHPKDANIVLYCGCCPFDICPNVRPAFSLLNEMGFSNHKLLNLAENLKVDWIDKGYPMNN